MSKPLVALVAAATLIGALDRAALPRGPGFLQPQDTTVREAGAPIHPRGGTLVQELSIGSASGAPEYTFMLIASLAVTRNGSIYAVQQRPASVFLYDRNGKFIRNVGREGQGPGEYSAPLRGVLLPDERLALMDVGHRAVNIYATDGTPAGSFPVTGTAILFGDTAGFLYVQATTPRPPATSATAILRLRPDGSVVDTIQLPAFPATPQISTGVQGVSSRSTNVPFAPAGLWVWSPLGYMVSTYPSRYAVELRVPVRSAPNAPGTKTPEWQTGQPIFSIRRAGAAPLAISDSERAAQRTQLETNFRIQFPDFRWDGASMPRTKQFFTQMRVGMDGRIWLKLSKPDTYDVLEPDGRYVGEVSVAPTTNLFVMRGDTVWGSVRDSDDVPYIKRYHVAWR